MRYRVLGLLILVATTISGCTGVPKGLVPVSDFDASRYMGKWYEIARLDHSFERGLSQVTAEYTMRDDGGVKVINRGYSIKNEKFSGTSSCHCSGSQFSVCQ